MLHQVNHELYNVKTERGTEGVMGGDYNHSASKVRSVACPRS